MQTNKAVHKPPSRIKYEQNNPVISYRVTKETCDQLKATLKERQISFPRFVQNAIETDHAEAKTLLELRNQIKLLQEEDAICKSRLLALSSQAKKNSNKFYFECPSCKKRIVLKTNGTFAYFDLNDEKG